MTTTYSLYLISSDGGSRFRPVHCDGYADLMRSAVELLTEDNAATSAEAWFGRDLLFTVGKAAGTAADYRIELGA